jgi:hypothetical protein
VALYRSESRREPAEGGVRVLDATDWQQGLPMWRNLVRSAAHLQWIPGLRAFLNRTAELEADGRVRVCDSLCILLPHFGSAIFNRK